MPSLSFSNNQLLYLSLCTKLSNLYKTESHNTKLYVAQYNKSKRIDSLNWLGIKVIGKPLSHDIARAICELNTERRLRTPTLKWYIMTCKNCLSSPNCYYTENYLHIIPNGFLQNLDGIYTHVKFIFMRLKAPLIVFACAIH